MSCTVQRRSITTTGLDRHQLHPTDDDGQIVSDVQFIDR